ncbi:MAG: permease [Frankia sp.]
MVDKLWHAVGHALELAFSMTWEVTWALVLGFFLSAAVQAVVRRQTIVGLLGDNRPRTLAVATGLGTASSSCSYAAVALARALVRKGAGFTAAMAFEIASTNLVVELGIILALLLGWQFTLGEFVGGPIMIVVVALLFRAFLRPRLLQEARSQAERGVAGSMEGHAAMDMSVSDRGPLWRRLTSPDGFTAVSHIFVMEWAAVLRDIVGGLLIAGAIGAWVPDGFWRHFFLTDHPLLAKIWGPLVGPLVSVVSFVCSIGNVPLAAVLWNGGISFGGVSSFIFADLLIIPILIIYRKYYGGRMTAFLAATFYAAMVVAGYVVEILFGVAGLVPSTRHAKVEVAHVSWNYTTILNIVFLALAAVLLVRFARTGGAAMLAMMGGEPEDVAGPEERAAHEHAGHVGHAGHAGHHGSDPGAGAD